MQYRISAHAELRMRRRRIAAADVERVLEGHSMSWHDPSEESWVLSGIAADGRTLLVYVPDDNWPATRIITIKSTAWR